MHFYIWHIRYMHLQDELIHPYIHVQHTSMCNIHRRMHTVSLLHLEVTSFCLSLKISIPLFPFPSYSLFAHIKGERLVKTCTCPSKNRSTRCESLSNFNWLHSILLIAFSILFIPFNTRSERSLLIIKSESNSPLPSDFLYVSPLIEAK